MVPGKRFRQAIAAVGLILLILASPTAKGFRIGSSTLLDLPVDALDDRQPAATRPSHDPIQITGDADLLVPDSPVDDDGIRSGSGTADDPYVIANWHISSNDQDGISVFNTSRHLVIREVTITQDRARDFSTAIHIDQVRNLTIENVRILGQQSNGIAVIDTHGLPIMSVNVTGPHLRGVLVARSQVTLVDSKMTSEVEDNDQGGTGIECVDSRMTVRNTTFRSVHGFFASGPPPADNRCRSVIFEGNRIVTPRDDRDVGVFWVEDRLLIQGNRGPTMYVAASPEGTDVSITNNELQGLSMMGFSEDTRDLEEVIRVRNNSFDGSCACMSRGFHIHPSVDRRIEIVDNRFHDYPHGTVIEVRGASFVAEQNVFLDNYETDSGKLIVVHARSDIAEQARNADLEYQVLRSNDLLRHPDDRHGYGIEYQNHRAEEVRLVAETNYWGPDPPTNDHQNPSPPRWFIRGEVDFDPWSTTPNVLSDSFVQSYFADDGGLLPGPGPVATLAGLCLAALATRRFAT